MHEYYMGHDAPRYNDGFLADTSGDSSKDVLIKENTKSNTNNNNNGQGWLWGGSDDSAACVGIMLCLLMLLLLALCVSYAVTPYYDRGGDYYHNYAPRKTSCYGCW
jgi:hypothetical protein